MEDIMKLRHITSLIIGCALLFLAFTINGIACAEDFESNSASLNVYRDGLAHMEQTLTVDELTPQITVPILNDSAENIIALDNNEEPLDYDLISSNLTIYTLGKTQIQIEYDTLALTSKQGETWTLIFDAAYNLTVYLPVNSTIIYLNQMPTTINTNTDVIALTLFPGHWEISYILPLITPETTVSGFSFPIEIVIVIAIVIVALLIGLIYFFKLRKPSLKKFAKENPQLTKDDRAVIEFLIDKKGKAFEAEIRERFPDMPRTSLWRLVRRLERLEIIEVKKIGLENQVELKKTR